MARNGSGVYSLPAGYKAIDGQTIQSSQHNTPLEDIASDLNAARPQTAGGTGATSLGAALVTRPWATAARRLDAHISDHGMHPDDFEGANIGAKLTAMFTAAPTNGQNILIPKGEHSISTGLALDISAQDDYATTGRPNIIGAGMGQTTLVFSGTGSALTLIGPTWDATNTGVSRQTLRGFGIRAGGWDGGRTGLTVRRAMQLHLDDVEIIECGQAADFQDIVHLTLIHCTMAWNNYGFLGRRSDIIGVSNYGSPVNIVSVVGCKFANNRNHAIDLYDTANFVMLGGSVEANARWSGDAEQWGIRIRNAGYNGSAGVALYGVHFESSGGNADLWIDHNGFPCVYIVDGCDFVRVGTTTYVTNCIYFTATGTDQGRLLVRSGFRGGNGYVPDAGRKYIGLGITGAAKYGIDDEGSVYESAVETPIFNRRGFVRGSIVHAAARWGYDGSLTTIAKHNVDAVTRNGVGDYTLTFFDAARTTAALVTGSGVGVASVQPDTISTSSVRVLLKDFAGAAVDSTDVSVLVYDL